MNSFLCKKSVLHFADSSAQVLQTRYQCSLSLYDKIQIDRKRIVQLGCFLCGNRCHYVMKENAMQYMNESCDDVANCSNTTIKQLNQVMVCVVFPDLH